MGTASVLRPQDCLSSIPPWRRNRRFLGRVTEPGLGRKLSSLQCGASGLATDSARREHLGNVHNRYDRGLLGGKDELPGLLPLPDQLLQRAFSPLHNNLRLGELRESGSSSKCSILNQQKSWMLPPYDRRALIPARLSPARLSRASLHYGYFENHNSDFEGSLSRAPYQKLNISSESHMLALDNVILQSKWVHRADNSHASERKKEHSSMEGHETSSDGTVAATLQEESMYKASGKRLGHKRHLRRFFTEKFPDNLPTSSLSNLRKEACFENFKANFLKDIPPHADCVKKRVDVSCHHQCYNSVDGNTDSRLEHLGCDVQEIQISSRQGVSVEDNFARVKKNNGSALLARASSSPSSPADKSMLLSSMVSEKWAGPSFFNSPSPSCLPVPSFTMKLSRAMSTSLVAIVSADCAAQGCSNTVFDAKRSWDIAFATEDLRRLLHLDCPC